MHFTHLQQTDLWQSGQNGYHTYRIPALAVTNQGSLLAFCEGRRESRHDSGHIALLAKRSTDHGATWSEQTVIWQNEGHTCGNPAPLVDRETGTIWLLMTWNRGDDPEDRIIKQTSKDTRRVFITSSIDDGLSWAEPQEITADVKQPDWTWYATGPGAGIQIQNGPYVGRMVIACDHIEAKTARYYSHVIYSDDHGTSWQIGGSAPQDQTNECQLVELADGRLILNMRNYNRENKHRQIALSADGGVTWSDQHFDPTLIEPICQASIKRYSWSPSVILFANPAHTTERENLTLRASFDEGQSWPLWQTLFLGPSGYSDLGVWEDGRAACLYECGENGPYEYIRLARFAISQEV